LPFNPGEVVSQRVVGRFLADLFDAVITVDPHLHRVAFGTRRCLWRGPSCSAVRPCWLI
jgi:hypothetical protein